MFKLIDGGKTDEPESWRDAFDRIVETKPALVMFETEFADIPEHMRDRPVLVLSFSPRYETRLLVTDDGVTQKLSFGQHGEHVCFVPWDSILKMEPQKG